MNIHQKIQLARLTVIAAQASREVLMIPGIDVYLAHLLRRQITKATLLVGVALWLGFSILAYYWIIQL